MLLDINNNTDKNLLITYREDYLEGNKMAAIKNFVKNFKKFNKKGTRYEASKMEQVWDRTAMVATYKTPIL